MAYKVIATAPKLIPGFPSEESISPGLIITDPAQIEFIEGMRAGLRDVIFEKVTEKVTSKKKEVSNVADSSR